MIGDPAAALLQRARRTPLARAGIAALSRETDLATAAAALQRALDEDAIDAATAIALVIAAHGGRIAPGTLIRLAPDFEHIAFLPILVRATEGDRVTMLLDLVEAGRLSWEREAIALFLAAEFLAGEPPPQRLITRTRMLAREPVSTSAALTLAWAAAAIDDPETSALVRGKLPFGMGIPDAGPFRELLTLPVIDAIPEDEARAFPHTVVRTEPRVGRNDPCPCGSGKKYKKCHADQPQEPSRQSLPEQFRQLSPERTRLREELFDEMRPGELAQLDLDTLTTAQLRTAARRLGTHHRFGDAERFLAALDSRTDIRVELRDDSRMELAHSALAAGAFDVVERQIAAVDLPESELALWRVELAIARRDPDVLPQIEEVLVRAHRGDSEALYAIVFRMLRSYPAVGILLGRGALDRDRLLDTHGVLEEIGMARDRLLLPPEDPWWEIFERWIEQENAEAADAPPSAGQKGRVEKMESLRRALEDANRTTRKLERHLGERVAELERLRRKQEDLETARKSAPVAGDRDQVASLRDETQRLRAKIGELKGEISQGVTERAELRRRLATAAEAHRQESAAAAVDRNETDDDDELEGETVTARPRRVLIPIFLSSFSKNLEAVPSRIAAEAVRTAAALAAGDEHLWRGVKQMRRIAHLMSARIGRSHRLLFTLAADHLEVADLIHRRDLDQTIERLMRRK